MATDLVFLDSRPHKDEAWELCLAYAEALRRIGDVDRYGVKVQRIPRQFSWGVYLRDRYPGRQIDPHLMYRLTAAMTSEPLPAPDRSGVRVLEFRSPH